jgi:hypothetical protein
VRPLRDAVLGAGRPHRLVLEVELCRSGPPRRGLSVDEAAIATSYATAYVDMGFRAALLRDHHARGCGPDLDWRFHEGDLNEISARLQATYEYGFMVK